MTRLLVVAAMSPPVLASGYWLLMRNLGILRPWCLPLAWGAIAATDLLAEAGGAYWLPGAVSAGHILVAAAIWRWRKRNGRRSLAEYGAESRARIGDLVRAMRQRARPRGAVRPVPGGAW